MLIRNRKTTDCCWSFSLSDWIPVVISRCCEVHVGRKTGKSWCVAFLQRECRWNRSPFGGCLASCSTPSSCYSSTPYFYAVLRRHTTTISHRIAAKAGATTPRVWSFSIKKWKVQSSEIFLQPVVGRGSVVRICLLFRYRWWAKNAQRTSSDEKVMDDFIWSGSESGSWGPNGDPRDGMMVEMMCKSVQICANCKMWFSRISRLSTRSSLRPRFARPSLIVKSPFGLH